MIDKAIGRYLGHLKYVQGGAKNTLVAYQTDLRQFRQIVRDAMGVDPALEQISATEIDAFTEWMESKEFAPATIARKLAALRSFFQYLQTIEGISMADLSEVATVDLPERASPRSLNGHQVQRLLEAPMGSHAPRDIRDAAILGTLYATGLKAAETVGLTLHDVDIQRGLLDRPGSNSLQLPLGIAHHPVERYVKEGRPQLMRDRSEQALFLNQRGNGLSRQGLWLIVKKWSNVCNLGDDVSPYTLRHSLTRHLLQSGRSRREVQKVLGLSSPNSVRVYANMGFL